MANPLYFTDEKLMKAKLRVEIRKLEKIARKKWEAYIASYTPKRYVRTGNSLKSLKVDETIHYLGVDVFGAHRYGMRVYWQNDLVYHNSIFKGVGHKKGHSVMLIGTYWYSKKLESKKGHIPRFTRSSWYGGDSYLSDVIKDYENSKDSRMSIEVEWSGKFLK